MVGEAEKRNVSGWVRNVHDGTVEAVVSGDHQAVQEVLNACHNGPAMANVTQVDVSDAAPPEQSGFDQCASV
jgi:acylphosphatase